VLAWLSVGLRIPAHLAVLVLTSPIVLFAAAVEPQERFCFTDPHKLHFPWYHPAPKPDQNCCRLPEKFGPNVVGITCVAGTFLRPGESCWVACKNGCRYISLPAYAIAAPAIF
jgi:hypothetical protein